MPSTDKPSTGGSRCIHATPGLCAKAHGFSLVAGLGPHAGAGVRCGADQRKQLERLCSITTTAATSARPACEVSRADHSESSGEHHRAGSRSCAVAGLAPHAWRARPHKLGTLTQTGVRYRHRTLALGHPVPELRRALEDHRGHRGCAGDRQNPRPSGPAHPSPAARPGAAIRVAGLRPSVPSGLIGKPRLVPQPNWRSLSAGTRACRPAGDEISRCGRTPASRQARKSEMVTHPARV